MKSIKIKLVVALLSSIVVSVAIVGFSTGFNMIKTVNPIFWQQTEKELLSLDNYVNVLFNEMKYNISFLATEPLLRQTNDTITTYYQNTKLTDMSLDKMSSTEIKLHYIFKRFKETHPSYKTVLFGTNYGGFIMSKLSPRKPGYNPPERGWYKQALTAPGSPIITDAEPSTDGKSIDLSVVQSIQNGSETLGVIAIDITLSDLTQKIEDITIGKEGFAILLQGSSIVLADPRNSDNNFKEVADIPIYKELVASNKNLNKVTIDGIDYTALLLKSKELNFTYVGFMSNKEIMAPFLSFLRYLIIITIIVIAIMIGVSLLIANFITEPILSAVEITKSIAKGDLSVEIDHKYISREDEIGVLLESLFKMKENLMEIVSKVLASVKQIEKASISIADDNLDLSNRTEQQAAALEETFAAIEEMNGSVKSNADNTKIADRLSREATDKTGAGSSSVHSVIESMNEINSSSNRIADIIEVINNIAFQTNLLALNASIEAARAGEQGKGFAVVAVEVRKLAKRSDKAASEISEIIKSSNIKVDQGVEIANKAGEVLNEINGSVRKVTNLVVEISAASQEQLTSVDEIDKTLASLDKNTQMNSSMVEKASEATERLSRQAIELSTLINFFKIGNKKTESYTLLNES